MVSFTNGNVEPSLCLVPHETPTMNAPLSTAVPPSNLVDSQACPQGLRGLGQAAFSNTLMRLFGVVDSGIDHPMPEPTVFPPYADSMIYGCTHYGIMIPDLPAPHHFLACAAIIGFPGMRAFDIDHAVDPDDGPRHTATLAHGTAAAVDAHFSSYSTTREMELRDDGSLLRFGKDLTISGLYPNYRLQSRREGFEVDLELTATGDITWFCRSPIYSHLALSARYRGRIALDGKPMEVSGLCTYEYARGTSLHLPRNKIIPPKFKLPWTFFTYQTIKLDDQTQLLLTHCRFFDYPALTAAWLVTIGRGSVRLPGEVRFRVLSLQDEPGVAPDGRETRLPRTFEWDIRDPQGRSLFEISATADTPMLFGLGNGFIGGYRWEGTRDGQPATGRGYLEYVDQRG